MSFNVYWDDDAHTLLCWHQTEPATIEGFRAAFKLSHVMVANIDHKFHMVIRGTGEMPRLPLGEIQNAFRNASPQQDLIMIINQDVLTRSLMSVLQKMRLPLTDRIIFVRDMDEARSLIAQRRSA